jgi:uncharacterized membrane protein YgaE (UPF0421/DUF939 family)
MWAVIATIFVYRWSYSQSVGAALSRIAATALSFVLCFVYLLFFPFHLWGMGALIGIGAIVMSLVGRPDGIITTESRPLLTQQTWWAISCVSKAIVDTGLFTPTDPQ